MDEVEAIGFPSFVGGVMCAHGYCHTLSINIPMHVGGMTIYPGDLLHGDRNGVTTIPAAIASQVAHVCKEFMEAEDIVLNYVALPILEARNFIHNFLCAGLYNLIATFEGISGTFEALEKLWHRSRGLYLDTDCCL